MAGELVGGRINVPCPGCGYKTRKTGGWLRAHNEFTCVGCGTRVTMESRQFHDGLWKVEDSLDKLGKASKRFGQ